MTDNGNQEAVVARQESEWDKVLADLQASGRISQLPVIDADVLQEVRQQIANPSTTDMDSLAAIDNIQIEQLALLDPLTELYNPKVLNKELQNALRRAVRYRQSLCLCLIAIDGHQDIIGRLGHLTGDAILRVVSKVILETVRQADLAGRYTSNQFAIILPDTDSATAAMVGDQLRKRIGTQAINHNWQSLRITASLGIASYPQPAQQQEELIALAVQALKVSIQRGGDRLCIL